MLVQIDFSEHQYCFEHPITLIETWCLHEVKACLAQVEQYCAAGYYAAGYMAYEAAPAFCPDAIVVAPNANLPLLWFAIFKQPVCGRSPAITMPEAKEMAWQANVTKEDYWQAIATIKKQIEQGNTYQTNYTFRLRQQLRMDPYCFYQHLKEAQLASYCAYIESDQHCILSASPELFFQYCAGEITTKPMKGTAPRGRTISEDNAYKKELLSSKNRAENMMIVDLLRNDLNQIATTGSVRVEPLFEVEKYPTVWQLTSTVQARLGKEKTITDIFSALFPCGSITGAPKLKTMQLIAALEPEPRGIYCGTIGVITPYVKEAIFNVAIRTILVDKDTCEAIYGTGGGITWESTAAAEYQEAIDKARILTDNPLPHALIETLLLEKGRYFLLERHLHRLRNSAHYFQFCYPESLIRTKLEHIAKSQPQQCYKVRLLLQKMGQIALEIHPITVTNAFIRASFAPFAVHSSNRFLYHKTTQRTAFPTVTNGHDYLLRNEREEITEFVHGNVAVCFNGHWYTPPIRCGLLAGTYRAQLLAEGRLKEKCLYSDDILHADEIALINSVRRWQKVQWCAGITMPKSKAFPLS